MKLGRGFGRTLPALALGALLVGAVACGDAEIGEECDESGSADECESGAVCTNEQIGMFCRALCRNDAQCPETQLCQDVPGPESTYTGVKSCQPKRGTLHGPCLQDSDCNPTLRCDCAYRQCVTEPFVTQACSTDAGDAGVDGSTTSDAGGDIRDCNPGTNDCPTPINTCEATAGCVEIILCIMQNGCSRTPCSACDGVIQSQTQAARTAAENLFACFGSCT